MSNAVAGVIGAFVTLGLVGLAGAFAFLVLRRRRSKDAVVIYEDKGSISSKSDCV